MGRLYLVGDGAEIVRRRALVPRGHTVEAWADLVIDGGFWLGDQSKDLLDSVGAPLKLELEFPAESIAVYYGPKLGDIESLPTEESLKSRVLSAHAIAVAWITLDRFGERTSYQPAAPTDPVFYLRRPGGGSAHVWRLFQRRREAIGYMAEHYGKDSEGAQWAEALSAEDFDELLRRHAIRP